MNEISENSIRLAQSVRDACIAAAKQGYENAAISGLCEEGALEAAISAIYMVDLEAALRDANAKPL
ncbi:MAG: acetyltransferase [Candidatus Muproteobacteria bacterium RBG_16_60_9]|uniref:Acetyltransferase n=1 Tax=Candidatus Muproteobacteria bacterium RBG_16_60_9 TaxID=1817755 RepID=A0A1F6VAF7_9PROT|nr:MAG: acetyltransferase [Candidatus Muproteobacteria bacterium RBG_16_60_9]